MSDATATEIPPESDSALPDCPDSHVLTGRGARVAATVFNYGNIVAVLPGLLLTPFILLAKPTGISLIVLFALMIIPPILWFGASMVVYAMARHHPNPRVGEYTQQAAYRFYALFGTIIPVGTFFGTDWVLWIITGGVIALILIPWSIRDLLRIHREHWEDIEVNTEEYH